MRPIKTLLILALFSAPLQAQTVGVPGFNDFTMDGFISGSQSCTRIVRPSHAPLTLEVSTAPGNAVVMFVSPARCAPAMLPGCQGTSLDLAAPLIFFHGDFADAAGQVSAPPVTVGFLVIFSAQAVILDASCPGELLYTQAYDVLLK